MQFLKVLKAHFFLPCLVGVCSTIHTHKLVTFALVTTFIQCMGLRMPAQQHMHHVVSLAS